MIKIMILIRSKPGQDAKVFADYYENRHVPLIQRHVGHCMQEYRRNFVNWEEPLTTATLGAPAQAGFHVITEIIVKDRAAMEQMFAIAGDPQVAAEIAADEEKFVDRAASRMFIVEEKTSLL